MGADLVGECEAGAEVDVVAVVLDHEHEALADGGGEAGEDAIELAAADAEVDLGGGDFAEARVVALDEGFAHDDVDGGVHFVGEVNDAGGNGGAVTGLGGEAVLGVEEGFALALFGLEAGEADLEAVGDAEVGGVDVGVAALLEVEGEGGGVVVVLVEGGGGGDGDEAGVAEERRGGEGRTGQADEYGNGSDTEPPYVVGHG